MTANIPIFMSAMGPKMAKVVGKYGDGVITSSRTPEYIDKVLFPAIREGCKESGRSFDSITKVVELDMAYGKTYEEAVKALRKWAATLINEIFTGDISDPREIEARGAEITDEQLAEVFPIGTNEEEFIKRIEQNFKVGFQHAYVQLNTQDEEAAIELFRKKVLPYFRNR
jgi:alkanesulfonate monooxygenase SsuD/methylene tetrahydromethanopterin reductase-like flavin-dependent oxidoreductase (luciferase family)